MCFFYVMYLISGRVLAPGMCALAASTCYTMITPACVGKSHNFFHASSLSHYLSQISDSINTSVFSVTKRSKKLVGQTDFKQIIADGIQTRVRL